MYVLPEDTFTRKSPVWSEYALEVSSEVLMMAHMMACVLLLDGSYGSSISVLLVGAEEGGLSLVNLKLIFIGLNGLLLGS